jgi:hypothetical protein
MTSLKNRLPRDAAATNNQAANKIFQWRLGEAFVSVMTGDGTGKVSE